MYTHEFTDVMMPSFHANKYSGFFFVAFIAFGLYYLMSIIFAVIYHHYHEDNARFVRKMTNNRARALDAAFKQMIIFGKELEYPSYQLDSNKLDELDYNEEKIYFPLFRRFIQFRRRKICDQRTRVLYNAMCEARARTEAVKLHEDEGNGISREQWQNLYKFVNVEIFRDPSYAVEHMIKKGKENVMVTLILGDENMYSIDGGCCARFAAPFQTDGNVRLVGDRKDQCCFQCTQKIYFTWLRFRGLLYRTFTHPVVAKLIDILVWFGTMVLIYELSRSEYDETLDNISNTLIYIFVVEVTLRFIAFGRYFFRDGFNVLDFVVVYSSLFVDMFDANGKFEGHLVDDAKLHQQSRSNGIVAFRLLRFVRALGTIERFKMIITTSLTVLKKIGVLFSLEFCVFYIFAVIGVFCYGGIVSKDSTLKQINAAIESEDVDDTTFWEYVRDNYYYDNNMNAISNTMVVMLELTVVNQWHAITRMYKELTSPWAYLYFYCFYFVSVLIVTNVLTAFVFDSFIIQFQFVQMEQEELQRKKARQQRLKRLKKLKKDKQIMKQKRINQKKFKKNNSKRRLNLNNIIPVSSTTVDPVVVSAINGYQGVNSYETNHDGFPDNDSLSIDGSDLYDPHHRRGGKKLIMGTADKIDENKEEDNPGSDEIIRQSTSMLSREENTFLDHVLKRTEDVLDEFIEELNQSDKEDWHKWIAIAMLYEFETEDVVKGVWLYDRKKTTADFYEQIYGEIRKPFIQYLKDWDEELPEDTNDDDDDEMTLTRENTERSELSPTSMREDVSGGGAAVRMERGDTLVSVADSAATFHSSTTIRGRGKDIFIPKAAVKKRKSILNGNNGIIAMTVEDENGNIDQIDIKGPKQSSIFSALSTAPQVGFAPQFTNTKQAGKAAKLLDFYQPPSPHNYS